MAVGRTMTGIATFLVLLLGGTLIGGGIWLTTRPGPSECVSYFKIPLFVIGGVLLGVAALGFLGVVLENPCMIFIYILITILAILAMAVFTVLAFVATNATITPISGLGYSVYRVPDFSSWLQNYVNNQQQWQGIAMCIKESGVCSSSAVTNFTVGQVNVNFSPVQVGCCFKPPFCNGSVLASVTGAPSAGQVVGGIVNYALNATANTSISSLIPYLAPPPPAPDSNSTDCGSYSSDNSTLCYSCETCKAGFLKNMQDLWRTIAYVNLAVLLLLILVSCFGCCAFHTAKYHEHFYKGGF